MLAVVFWLWKQIFNTFPTEDRSVPPDLPADVRTTLAQTLSETREHADDSDTATALLDTVRRVTANKVPDSEFRDRLLFGCSAATEAFEDGDTAAAAEYVAAMERQLPEE